MFLGGWVVGVLEWWVLGVLVPVGFHAKGGRKRRTDGQSCPCQCLRQGREGTLEGADPTALFSDFHVTASW